MDGTGGLLGSDEISHGCVGVSGTSEGGGGNRSADDRLFLGKKRALVTELTGENLAKGVHLSFFCCCCSVGCDAWLTETSFRGHELLGHWRIAKEKA